MATNGNGKLTMAGMSAFPVTDYAPCAGVRYIKVSGDLVHSLPYRDLTWLFDEIRRQCPKDTAVMRLPHGETFQRAWGHEWEPLDAYVCYLVSSHWEPVPEGGIIPPLEIEIRGQEVDVIGLSRTWWQRWYDKTGMWFVRKFPKWIYLG